MHLFRRQYLYLVNCAAAERRNLCGVRVVGRFGIYGIEDSGAESVHTHPGVPSRSNELDLAIL